MSDADHDAVTVSADDITVRKTVDTEQFQTLAVVFELISEREETTRVQVVDSVPASVPIDDIGFHPDYGAEHWSVEDDTVAFERDLAADEAYTTIYGIRGYPEDEIDALLGDPDLDLVDVGPENLDSVLDEDRSDVIRDFISGKADLSDLGDEISVGTDEPEAAEASESFGEPADPKATEPQPAEVDEPASDDLEPVVTEADDPATEHQEEQEVPVPQSGGVVRVLIKELQEGDIDSEHRQLLRDELLDTKGTVEAQVTHLQQRMSNLEAYTDALEEFIDEEGGAQEVLAELRADIRALEQEFRSKDDQIDDAIDRLDSVQDRFETVAEDAETAKRRSERLSERFDAVEDDVADIDERVSDLRRELNSYKRELRDDIETLEEDFEAFEEFHERLSSVFGDEGGRSGPPHHGNGE